MNRFETATLLVSLVEGLRANGSWAGETHLQKATYVLQRLLDVPVGFDFILYKHGPFSFDLRNEVASLRAEGFFEWEVKSERYGPSLKPGPLSEQLKTQFGSTANEFASKVDFVAGRLGKRNVAELERLATAIYVTLDEKSPLDQRTARINSLKRHVSLTDAEIAVEEADELIAQATNTFPKVMTI
jgi:uncharacterized protein YwgA